MRTEKLHECQRAFFILVRFRTKHHIVVALDDVKLGLFTGVGPVGKEKLDRIFSLRPHLRLLQSLFLDIWSLVFGPWS